MHIALAERALTSLTSLFEEQARETSFRPIKEPSPHQPLHNRVLGLDASSTQVCSLSTVRHSGLSESVEYVPEELSSVKRLQ